MEVERTQLIISFIFCCKNMHILIWFGGLSDTPPNSLEDSNVSPKVKITEEGIGVRSFACSTLRVEGCAKALGWGLRQVTSESIIHINLHKLNNKLVSAWLEHFWCTNKPRAYTNSQDSPWPKLGRSHHLPPYSFSVICPSRESRNFRNWDFHHFGSP